MIVDRIMTYAAQFNHSLSPAHHRMSNAQQTPRTNIYTHRQHNTIKFAKFHHHHSPKHATKSTHSTITLQLSAHAFNRAGRVAVGDKYLICIAFIYYILVMAV